MANVRVALIYGSTARGSELASSDMDLMVIGDVDGWSGILVRLH